MTFSRLRTVLLIDDSHADNFLHQRVLRQMQCADQIQVCTSVEDALQYLNTTVDGHYPQPDLILLDINMPGLNGWDFLETYAELPAERRSNALLIMLTTSLNPEDRDWASKNPLVSGFFNKPLTQETLEEILDRYFGPQLDDR
jgi:CheY-like chemotaxis protein